jgi:hypothetical protein
MYYGGHGVIFAIAQIIFDFAVIGAMVMAVVVLKELLRAVHEISKKVYGG